MNIEDVKIGMQLRRIKQSHSFMKVGDINIVTSRKTSDSSGRIYVLFNGNTEISTHGHLPCYLEPVPPVKHNYNHSKSECAEPVVHKFHVGQPVRCITDILSPMKLGSVNIIHAINDEPEGRSLSFESFTDGRAWMSQHFASAYKLEVGCKVMVVGFTVKEGYVRGFNGKTGTMITGCSNKYRTIRIDETGGESNFEPENLIVLEPAPNTLKNLHFTSEFAAGDPITKEEFDKEYRHTLDELTGVTRGYDWGNISHKSPFDDCTYQSEKIKSDVNIFSLQDIEKCMEDIKKEPLDKYGKWALEHYDSIMEENKMEIQQINERIIVEEITGEPVTAVGAYEGRVPAYITKENKYILLRETFDVGITPDDVKKIMKDKSKSLSKFYYEGFVQTLSGYSVEKVK